MKKLFLLAALLVAFTSCHYKDLCYDHNHAEKSNLTLHLNLKLDLDVDLDVSVEAHTKIEIPTYLKVCFYDSLSGNLVKTELVGPYGGPLHIMPGNYNMVVYSFDTEWTWVRGENKVSTLEAYTSDITEMKAPLLANFARAKENAPGPIIYTPDHLLVTRKMVEIPPYSTDSDYTVTITAAASTVVETYGFEVANITGIQYISSVEAFVTNQARSDFFGINKKNDEPATIYFPIEVHAGDTTLHTTFNTFGKLPGESHSFLHIVMIDSEGNVYTVSEDISDQFNDAGHVIHISDSIDIPKPESASGGIAPTVDPWEEINHDVPIG